MITIHNHEYGTASKLIDSFIYYRDEDDRAFNFELSRQGDDFVLTFLLSTTDEWGFDDVEEISITSKHLDEIRKVQTVLLASKLGGNDL